MAKTLYSQTRPATVRQKIYMQERCIEFPSNITVAQASALIGDYQATLNDGEPDDDHIMDCPHGD